MDRWLDAPVREGYPPRHGGTNAQYLVETNWLASHLGDPSLRVLECATIFHARPEGGYRAESVRATWSAGHIPRSGFADLTGDLSDRSSSLLYMMPLAEKMAAAMARLGVGEGTRVVLYDRAVNLWAARVWWMLRAVGFDDAAVLNGGWRKWTRRAHWARTARDVHRQRARGGAASRNRQRELRAARTHRRSTNVAARSLVDPVTHAYLPPEVLREKFAARASSMPSD